MENALLPPFLFISGERSRGTRHRCGSDPRLCFKQCLLHWWEFFGYCSWGVRCCSPTPPTPRPDSKIIHWKLSSITPSISLLPVGGGDIFYLNFFIAVPHRRKRWRLEPIPKALAHWLWLNTSSYYCSLGSSYEMHISCLSRTWGYGATEEYCWKFGPPLSVGSSTPRWRESYNFNSSCNDKASRS